MDIASSGNIIRALTNLNHWWELGSVRKEYAKPVKRSIYYEASRMLKNGPFAQTICTVGLNGVGKTVLLHQLIEYLIGQGVKPRRILYITFDAPIFRFSSIEKILGIYHDSIYEGTDIYYVLDEIQFTGDSEAFLRHFSQLCPNGGILAAASVRPDRPQAPDGAEGRPVTMLFLPTLSFYEYCQISMDKALPRLGERIVPSRMMYMGRRDADELLRQLSPLRKTFLHYLQAGGFPHTIGRENESPSQMTIQESVVGKTILRDIPTAFHIRDGNDLAKVFLYLCFHSPGITSFEALSKALNGISRPTIERYVKYLERAGLIYISHPVELGGKRLLKIQPKIYIADSVVCSSMTMQYNVLTSAEQLDAIAESTVYKHIHSFYAAVPGASVGYYRKTGAKNKEIDIIAATPKGKLFFDVAYRDQYHLGPGELIWSLSGEAQSCLIITKKDNDYGMVQGAPHKLYRLPAHAFLYLMGHARRNGQHTDGSGI